MATSSGATIARPTRPLPIRVTVTVMSGPMRIAWPLF